MMGVIQQVHLALLVFIVSASAFKVSLPDILRAKWSKSGEYVDGQDKHEFNLLDLVRGGENEDGGSLETDEGQRSRDFLLDHLPNRHTASFDGPDQAPLAAASAMTRERRQPHGAGQSSVLPPWSEFCGMLNMRDCSRYKRQILKRFIRSPATFLIKNKKTLS